ncbi:hypothetical protein [Natrinema salaciae]|uniref:Integral membrane protein n=1 Tax=Natrinema salaciae TaxID=1186196 RepID=A0A1H8ZJN0_9EURY|nr:hypothetical protein [Natrinema salaciae]SEP64531.1 hypothetical protein SAMN04489841_0188 [Natrinema salaciae]
MIPLQGLAVAVVGIAIVFGCAAAVYRDASRIGVSRPGLWGGLVFATCGSGLGIYLAPPDVPIPGLLVIVLAGPALYLFERDDTKHGDEAADPHALPDDPGDAPGEGHDE